MGRLGGALPGLRERAALARLPTAGQALSERGREGTPEHSHWVWGQPVLLGLHFQRLWRGRVRGRITDGGQAGRGVW